MKKFAPVQVFISSTAAAARPTARVTARDEDGFAALVDGIAAERANDREAARIERARALQAQADRASALRRTMAEDLWVLRCLEEAAGMARGLLAKAGLCREEAREAASEFVAEMEAGRRDAAAGHRVYGEQLLADARDCAEEAARQLSLAAAIESGGALFLTGLMARGLQSFVAGGSATKRDLAAEMAALDARMGARKGASEAAKAAAARSIETALKARPEFEGPAVEGPALMKVGKKTVEVARGGHLKLVGRLGAAHSNPTNKSGRKDSKKK